MGRLLSVLSAFVLFCYGIHIFREPAKVGGGPLVSTYMFAFSVFLLLWDIGIYPRSLRMMAWTSQTLLEFFISVFLIENIMCDFWFPLEICVMGVPPKIAEVTEEMLHAGDWECDMLCYALRDDWAMVISSYLLSTFFFIEVLHATRIIDLREMECGVGFFIKSVISRAKRTVKKTLRMLGIGKRRVQIKGRPSTKSSSVAPFSPRRCSSDDGDDDLHNTFSDFEMSDE